MPSPRHVAAHMLMPAFLREQRAVSALDAIERGDDAFLIPVWMRAAAFPDQVVPIMERLTAATSESLKVSYRR